MFTAFAKLIVKVLLPELVKLIEAELAKLESDVQG